MSNQSKKQQGDWEKEFDKIYYYQRVNKPNGGCLFVCQNSHLKSLLQQARAETLKEAIAYLIKKNPVRVPSSVMVDYTEAITNLEKLAIIIKNKLK